MDYSPNYDFGNFFNDLISNSISSKNTSSDDFADGVDYDYDYDYDKLKREYDELKSDFALYKNRVQNTLETEKKLLKNNLIRSFLSEFVVFMVNTYKGKKVITNTMTEEDYLILKKMNDYLDSMGVRPMEDATGKEFDYSTMEAVYSDSDSGMPPNKVTKVIYNGFTMDGEVILPQKVAVSV